jgi:hypothetical protein
MVVEGGDYGGTTASSGGGLVRIRVLIFQQGGKELR